MKSFGDLVNNSRHSEPFIKGVKAAQIIDFTSKVLAKEFGEAIGEHAKPAYFKNETLTIACLSPSIAQEIKFIENKILNELKNSFPNLKISKISYLS
jgi:hypothetical protein